MWQCCIACRSIRPACSLYAGRLEPSAAVPVVAGFITFNMLAVYVAHELDMICFVVMI